MDCAHNGATLVRQCPQQLYGIKGRRAVQATVKGYSLKVNATSDRAVVDVAYVVGSSKNSTAGLSISSKAIDRRFFWPPLSFEHLVCLALVSFNVFNK